MKKYLKGFANLGYFGITTNTSAAYACEPERTLLTGASSCAPTDNKTDFSIPADDGVWDSGSDWTDTTLVITVVEAELANLAQLIGAEFDTELKESTFDEPNEVALTFSALRRDGGYRLYRYFCCKCTGYKVTHNTKGTNNDAQTYELTYKCIPREIDHLIRSTKDVDKGTALTYITNMEGA